MYRYNSFCFPHFLPGWLVRPRRRVEQVRRSLPFSSSVGRRRLHHPGSPEEGGRRAGLVVAVVHLCKDRTDGEGNVRGSPSRLSSNHSRRLPIVLGKYIFALTPFRRPSPSQKQTVQSRRLVKCSPRPQEPREAASSRTGKKRSKKSRSQYTAASFHFRVFLPHLMIDRVP